jgi:hypothetical protein
VKVLLYSTGTTSTATPKEPVEVGGRRGSEENFYSGNKISIFSISKERSGKASFPAVSN